MPPLTDKVALITGASSGIGAATAHELANLGAAVVVTARRQDRIDDLAAQITAAGGKALAVRADASVRQEIDWTLAEAQRWGGRLDIVIANAGRGLAGGTLSSDLRAWEDIFAVNVLGASYLMRRAAELFVKQQHGDIVVLGSVAGHNISPFSGFYGASKWAVWAVAEALRREVCSQHVRVTTIKPAVVISEFQAVAGYGADFEKTAAKYGQPLAPADVARTIGFVVSQPPHVHLSEVVLRPTGQDYP